MPYTSQTAHWQAPVELDSGRCTPATSAPSTKSPTSAPQSADKERRPKLRASCDTCAASKVKCNKEHPICARCQANGSNCVYGVSRKHGKPGRTRKRNPDGTPFIKASKQRPSPDGSEFGMFRVQLEPILRPLPDLSETASNWSSNWSSTPSLPGTPELDFDFEFACRDPFAKRQSVQLDLPDIEALKSFVGNNNVNPMDYSFKDANLDPFLFNTDPISVPQSPKRMLNNDYNSMRRVSVSIPTSHCCYTLAYSTLESLRIIGCDASSRGYPSIRCKSLDNVLSVTRLAVSSVLTLLSCPCSSDPNLAMLYSSITSKLLTWYQIAAGVNVTSSALSTGSPSRASSNFSPPLSTHVSETEMGYIMALQPLQFGVYQFDEAERQRLRRQVVLRELKNCGQLVEALADWRDDGGSEQSGFLYDVLGAWLKSELCKTVREVEGTQAL